MHHLSIADKSGKSVVVEYIGGEIYVTETNIVTNHYLKEGEKYGIGSEQSHLRFDTLKMALDSNDGVMENYEHCYSTELVSKSWGWIVK